MASACAWLPLAAVLCCGGLAAASDGGETGEPARFVRPKPYQLNAPLFIAGYALAVLALHVILYRPWRLPMPFKAVLPVVHVALFASGAWAAIAVSVAADRITLAAYVWILSLLVGPIHTYLFFREQDYVRALVFIKIMVAGGALVCILFVLDGGLAVTTWPMLAAEAWMAYVLLSNSDRANRQIASSAKKRN